MHQTYVIGSTRWHVKIGHSQDPQSRVRELQTGSASHLWVAHTWAADRDGAIALERALHKAFAWRAMSGEWFNLTAPPAIAVGDLIKAGRTVDAERLITIIQRRDAIVSEQDELRRAWRWVPGRDRRRVELASAAARKALDAEDATLQLEAYDLGLWPAGATEKALPIHLARLHSVVSPRSNSIR